MSRDLPTSFSLNMLHQTVHQLAMTQNADDVSIYTLSRWHKVPVTSVPYQLMAFLHLQIEDDTKYDDTVYLLTTIQTAPQFMDTERTPGYIELKSYLFRRRWWRLWMFWRWMRRGRRRLPGDDAGGCQFQQMLDGVALSRLPASHPTQQAHVTSCTPGNRCLCTGFNRKNCRTLLNEPTGTVP
jgi:hypothetical protein